MREFRGNIPLDRKRFGDIDGDVDAESNVVRAARPGSEKPIKSPPGKVRLIEEVEMVLKDIEERFERSIENLPPEEQVKRREERSRAMKEGEVQANGDREKASGKTKKH